MHCLFCIFKFLVTADDHGDGGYAVLFHLLDQGEPVHPAHADVSEHDGRLGLEDSGKRLYAVSGGPNDFIVGA